MCPTEVIVSHVKLVFQTSVLSSGLVLMDTRLTVIALTEHRYDTEEIIVPQNVDVMLIIGEDRTLLCQKGNEYQVNWHDERVSV